jgi:hypothetical protein
MGRTGANTMATALRMIMFKTILLLLGGALVSTGEAIATPLPPSNPIALPTANPNSQPTPQAPQPVQLAQAIAPLYSAVPYGAVPYGAVSYGAVPYAAMPYPAPNPYATMPYGVLPTGYAYPTQQSMPLQYPTMQQAQYPQPQYPQPQYPQPQYLQPQYQQPQYPPQFTQQQLLPAPQPPTIGIPGTLPPAPSGVNPYGNPGYGNPAGYAMPSYPMPSYPMPSYPMQPGGYVYSQPQASYPMQQPAMAYPMPGYGNPYANPYANSSGPVPFYPQPVYQQPQYPQPVYQQPVYQQPVYQQPVYQQPMQAVTVLPPVAAPMTVRSVNPSYLAAPLAGYPAPVVLADQPLKTPVDKEGFLIGPNKAQQLQTQNRPLFRSTALTKPSVKLLGAYVYQGNESSARARLQALYPLSSRVLFGATIDLSTGTSFTDTPSAGLNINELYLTTSLPEIPNLRFSVGQLDLTSYFDRNSFAKDGTTHFFNPIFQTNPALAAVGIGSRPGLLVNWSLTDNIEIKGATFSSSRSIGDFALNGFAGEVGFRYGNAIIRGTYATGRESGSNDGFKESFQIARGGGQFGQLKGDREEAFGVNAEVFIPKLKMGLFGRYGRYNNLDMGEGGDTVSLGVSFLDLFAPDDRLGIAYGQDLSNDARRVAAGNKRPDALEVFYDFKLLNNLRMGFSIQERNSFSELVAGFRVKTEFDITPKGDR